MVVGVYFLYNGLGHSGVLMISRQNVDPLPSTTTSPVQSAVEIHGNLQWFRDFATAQARANLENKPLFVDFYATWCANCKAFAQLTLQDIRLNTALQQAILAKIYDTDPIFRVFQQDANFPELRGVGGQPFLPLFAIYAPPGLFVWKGQNYAAVQTMVAQLERAKSASIQ
jgi:thiol:disulfide interchange protein DsbD